MEIRSDHYYNGGNLRGGNTRYKFLGKGGIEQDSKEKDSRNVE